MGRVIVGADWKDHWNLRWWVGAMAEKLSPRVQALREVGVVNSGRGSTRLAYSLSLPRTTDSLSSSRSSSSSARDLISSTSSMRSSTSLRSRILRSPPSLRLPSLTCDCPVSKCRASPILITDLLVSRSPSLSFSLVFGNSRYFQIYLGLSFTFYLSFSRQDAGRFGVSSCGGERESFSCWLARVRSAEVLRSRGGLLAYQKVGSGRSCGWLGKCVSVKRSGWGLQLPEQLTYLAIGCHWGGGKEGSKCACSTTRSEESCFQEQLEAVR